MRAIQKFGDGKDGMGLRDVPEPVLGASDLLIEVAVVGICGSDIHIWRDEKEHRRPVTLGHEFSGEVVGKGDKVCGEGQVGDEGQVSDEWHIGWTSTSICHCESRRFGTKQSQKIIPREKENVIGLLGRTPAATRLIN